MSASRGSVSGIRRAAGVVILLTALSAACGGSTMPPDTRLAGDWGR